MSHLSTHRRVLIVALALGCLSAGATPYAASATAATPQEVIDPWRARFPDEPYVCWQKKSPWDGLDKLQTPPAGVAPLKKISVDMGKNEYESASFVLTNLSDKPMTFEITCDSVGDIATTLRKAVWVTLNDGSQVNDALSLIDDGRVVIPSGESLEIWITLHSNHVEPGQYKQTIHVLPQGLEGRAVDIDVDVHDVSLPERLPLAVFYWDELVAAWMTPELTKAYMTDLKNHYVNGVNVHPWPLPRLAVDAEGQLVTDYAKLDRTLDGYKTLAPQRFIFFWAAEACLEPTGDWSSAHPESKGRPEFMTDEWKRLFREWLTGWVAHMKERGIGYDGFVMHPYDERGGPEVQAMIKLIKEVDPNIPVLFNGAFGRTVEELENNIAPYVDAWAPHLYRYLDAGGVNGCLSQTVSLEPGTAYTLSFYGKNGGAAIYYDLIFDGATNRHAQMLDAADWRQATFSFTTASDTSQVQVRFFPTLGNKTVLIDDVVLRSSPGSDLVVNGDMEAGRPPRGWQTTSAKVVADRKNPHSGRQCAKVTNIPLKNNPAKEAAKRLLAMPEDKSLWTYANPPTGLPAKASPYHFYRLPVWRAWKEGMTGFSNWTYKGGRWDSTGKGANWGMVYLTGVEDCPAQVSKQERVVPSKRWEASREGVEDYAYLHLLRSAINDSSLPPLSSALRKAKKVLAYWTDKVVKEADNDQAELADKAKAQIMKAISALSSKP